MAAKREVEELADKVSGLRLDPGGQLLDMEELVYKASPEELETLRKQVLQKQSLSGFDDEGLIKRFVNATKPKKSENGAGDNNQSYFNCFQNQIMMPTIVDKKEQIPDDLAEEWLCAVCPQADRVLVIASHKSTRVYDMEGTWICEHDTHLPGGSPSDISKVEDEGHCTILDCLYNDEHEIYYVVDLLCWKGQSFYKYETSVRMTSLGERMKDLPSVKLVSQTNPFRFYTLPVSEGSQRNAVISTVAEARFEITGLLFYHKRALYLPGLSPLGVWVETSYVPSVLDISEDRLKYHSASPGKQNWRKTRYEMSSDEVSGSGSVSKKQQKNRSPRGNQDRNFSGQRGGQYRQFPNYAVNPFFPSYGNYGAGGYGGGFGGYNMNYMFAQQQGFYPQRSNYNQRGYGQYNQANYNQYNYNQRSYHQQAPKEGKKSKKGGDPAMKRLQLSIPVPDDRPNWADWERHEVMMSVSMEYIPEHFEREYLAVICPVAKRRIVVSYLGWTCSYNKLLHMDRKFQSSLPGGNVRSVQVIKSNDMCILDCLHLKAERTFYILDLMHWKQLPYYSSESDFRFHWINQVTNEMDLTSIHPENEYKFKDMPRIRCTEKDLYHALDNTTFKIDGILFFHIQGRYSPGTSPSVLWLEPGNIEQVLGWKPPEHILTAKKKAAASGSTAAASASS